MTSLIDVIFLLLLFFMLTSTFSKYGEVELMAAGQADGSAAERQKLFVSLGVEEVLLNGQPVDLDRIADLVRSQPQDGGGHLVLISPDDEANAQRLVDLLAVLRQVENLQTVVLG